MKFKETEIISPGSFEAENHFYPKVVNSQLHPMVSYFFNLNNDRLINRYCHLNPTVKAKQLEEILNYEPRYFYWAGSDLFYVTTDSGYKKMLLIETNSCPSGQKSMPPLHEAWEQAGYKTLIEQSFIPLLKSKRLGKGALGIIYDKNYTENSGYAHALSDLTGEKVYLIPHFNNANHSSLRLDTPYLEVRDPITHEWVPLRAVLRYVTQKPWNRIPLHSKTFIYNPVLSCLSGGRNKLIASKAYDLFNSEIESTGLKINVPETIRDVSIEQIPLWVQKFGGSAVIKIPYSNAGQGVFTITSQQELDEFLAMDHDYDQFIVQSLVGNYLWSSTSSKGRFYHVGTVPNKHGNIYVNDLRMMVISTPAGFRPVAIYARKAKEPLEDTLDRTKSWDVLGTNLSVKMAENEWSSEVSRLLLMDRKDFNTLGLGIDNLIEGFIQTVLSVIAIDKMAQNFITKKGSFRLKLFKSLNNDESLIKEIYKA